MDYFLDELNLYICNFLDIKDIYVLHYVNKKFNSLIDAHIYINNDNKERVLSSLILTSKYIHKDIFEITGGIKEYYKIPFLDKYRDVKRDYVDYIKYDDIDEPITRGIAYGNRNFLCFKIVYIPKEIGDPIQKMTVVLFQRYTESLSWRVASNPSGFYDWIFNKDYNTYDPELVKSFIKNTIMYKIDDFKFTDGAFYLY